METRYELETFKVKLIVSEPPGAKIGWAQQACNFLKPIYADLDADQEHVVLLLLNNKNRVIGFKNVSTGCQTASFIHPAIIFRNVLLYGACAVVLSHNHPSGIPDPSPEDNEITRRLKTCADIFGIRLHDHIILGLDSYYSFRERGMLEGCGEGIIEPSVDDDSLKILRFLASKPPTEREKMLKDLWMVARKRVKLVPKRRSARVIKA